MPSEESEGPRRDAGERGRHVRERGLGIQERVRERVRDVRQRVQERVRDVWEQGWDVRERARTVLDAFEHLVGGLGTAILALATLFWLLAVALAGLVGVGLLLAPTALRMVHVLADRERARLSQRGPQLIGPQPGPTRPRAALADRGTRRELGWLATHATFGFVLGLLGLVLPLNAVRDGTFPLWWWLIPEGEATSSLGFWPVHDWLGVFGVWLLGVAWIAVAVGFAPGMARLQAWPGRRLLTATRAAALRITELTATRAAALDAHATELRRIERSLPMRW